MNSPRALSKVKPLTPFPVPVVRTRLALAAYMPGVSLRGFCVLYNILQRACLFRDEGHPVQKDSRENHY